MRGTPEEKLKINANSRVTQKAKKSIRAWGKYLLTREKVVRDEKVFFL